jgi:hypothetical protein
MKRLFTLLCIVLASTSVFGQSTITVFNNGGQQFYVILNGIKQNSMAQTNVSVAGIKNGSYSMKLIFADGKTKDIDKNFFLEEPTFVTTRVVFKKGKGKLQLIGMEPAASQAPAENMVAYRPNETVVYSDAPVVTQTTTIQQNGTTTTNNPTNGTVGINVNTTVQDPSMTGGQGGVNTNVNTNSNQQTIQQTTTTTTNTNGGNPNQVTESVGININVTDPTMNGGQGGVNMSINMSGTDLQTQQSTTVSTTTTTTTTTNGSNGNVGSNVNVNSSANNQVNSTVSSPPQPTTVSTNQSIKCKNILSDEKKLIAELNEMNFDEDKKEIVLKDLESHCLTASQAYKIIEVFTFEADRIELSKYFYLRMIDKDKGTTLLQLFTFDASKMEFREFMRSTK